MSPTVRTHIPSLVHAHDGFIGQETGGEVEVSVYDLGDRGFCEWFETEALASLIHQDQDSHESLWIMLVGGLYSRAYPQI